MADAPPATALPVPAAAASVPAPAAATVSPPTRPALAAPAATESRDDMLVRMVRESAAAESPPVKLARSSEAPRVSPEIAAGYQALLNGQVAEARRAYAAAVASDPTSADAALGLATAEARAGNGAVATKLYRKVLDLDPRNATALAGLASMADFSRPDAVETQLRADIARYPQSAALLVALGNLYAEQSRWSEAQAAYFDALRLEPAGADILYNLAVSLDHLGKSRVAADYYRRALDSARGQPTQFDPAAAARRLAEIRP
jgi:tetratricopeptide (TPR) repeat protein